ncbi:hypothetical protein [Thermosipho africanus]|nr:hypothetical protein [Thermosipho africanus]
MKKAQHMLEIERTSLEDFWENYTEPNDLEEFILKFLELLSYEPTQYELDENTFLGKLMKFILNI